MVRLINVNSLGNEQLGHFHQSVFYVFTRLIDSSIRSLEEKVNAVVEAATVVGLTEPNERSETDFIDAIDVDFFVLKKMTETNELNLVQPLAAAQFQ